MKDEIISFETAKLAMEKGFDEYCNIAYDKDGKEYRPTYWECSSEINEIKIKCEDLKFHDLIALAPTQSLLQRWFREKHKLFVYTFDTTDGGYYWGVSESFSGETTIDSTEEEYFFDTYEEALEEGLEEALKLI